jgi:hypothetical protein
VFDSIRYDVANLGFILCIAAGCLTFIGRIYSDDISNPLKLYQHSRVALFCLYPLALLHVFCDFINMDMRLMKIAFLNTEGIFLNLQFVGFAIGSF